MAYDEELAHRIRTMVADELGLSEQGMFGGLAFLIDRHMAVVASGQGGLMVRADPAEADALLAEEGVEPMQMRGRPMTGWLRVDIAHLESDEQLARWVRIGIRCARSLPPKR